MLRVVMAAVEGTYSFAKRFEVGLLIYLIE